MFAWLLFLFTLTPLTQAPKPIKLAVPYETEIRSVAGVFWIERAAQVQAESNFNPEAISPVGAAGLVQVMPVTLGWWKVMGWIAKTATAFDIPDCFKGQNSHMLWLKRYWQDLDHRLAAYNAGQGSILKADAYVDEIGWPESDAWLMKGLPKITGTAHSKETQGYIKHNAANRESIQKKLTVEATHD